MITKNLIKTVHNAIINTAPNNTYKILWKNN